MDKLTEKLISIVPSPRQLKWHELEFYSFIHFGMNTFTGLEWGDGTTAPELFNPTNLDTDQWVATLRSAGIKAAILTCKHHDGFCLWPSAYTEYSLKNSPYKDGKGDIVKEMSESCKKYGLKFGVYLSPWDRHDKRYGTGDAYNDYFINQLTELLTNYGEIFSVWFDGACGEGPNGKKQEYDFGRYYELIRELMPDACITICGPDVRWCGNESADCRESEWNVVPERLSRHDVIRAASQQEDKVEFREKQLKEEDRDLGSRKALGNEPNLVWYPAEVDVSIRPGWFYHEEEDNKVKSLEQLVNIYYDSVGGNATLLLNIPPDKRGLIHENDVEHLKELGEYINKTFERCITPKAKLQVMSGQTCEGINNLKVDDIVNYNPNDDQETLTIAATFKEPHEINHVVIKEDIRFSQRVEEFEILAQIDGNLEKLYEKTTIGSRRICKFDTVSTNKIIIKIKKSRSNPVLKYIGIYEENN